ncbi:hypothetical protein ABZ816_37940 [Actinosynnema sp. NPDC047251]|uniref:Putative secreted protein n=1 Tax=Saccharothrix espanaensis (strain ATCC 51144 / DSM 44229 / JCM 9112 / NBRC 15066 / NRRL 15764) TaxID=1179773 RepID=K0K0X1_SACES|nr:hypothetical protein [Saccharothrix espanaensis]CCH30218.1 putative secreted protein [Saccharothrix espanaensis DSM 44229]
MRPLILSAAVFAAMLLPVSAASAADYTVPRAASGSATTRSPNSAIESAGASARGAVLAAGVDCVGWRYKILRLEELPSVALYSATVEASAICVS